MKNFDTNFNFNSFLKNLKRNGIFMFFSLFFIFSKTQAQTSPTNEELCQTGITIQVFSSTATNVVLGNAATFIFPPSTGQVTSYILTKVGTSTPFAQQSVVNTVGIPNNTFNFQIPESVTTADLIFVEMTVTNTNGDVCTVQDTLAWINSGSTMFPSFGWKNVNFPGNFGTYSNVLSTSNFDSNSFTFYPNPSRDVVNFSSSNTIETITIYNVLGQEVFSQQINSNKFILDISNQASGTYIAKVSSNGKFESVKIIKL
jgi:hypothetical protein